MNAYLLAGVLTTTIAATGVALTTPAPNSIAPVPGPGGVVEAIQKIVTTANSGDVDGLRRMLADATPAGSIEWTPADGFGETNAPPRFVDLTADGGVVESDDPTAFAAAMCGGKRAAPMVVRSIRAACPSGTCSWAIVGIERQFGDEPARRIEATVLLHYVDDGFRIFRWHGSSLGAPVAVVTDRDG